VIGRFEDLAAKGLKNWVIHGGRIKDKVAHLDMLSREVMPHLA
jgi:hypothetical protein